MTQGKQMMRIRLAACGAAVVTVAAGLATRGLPEGTVTPQVGDALYALLIFWLVVVVAPRGRGWALALVACGICVAIELFQLTGVPAALGASSGLVRLVLGTTFHAPDLPWYAVGAAAGWALHGAANRLAVPPTSPPAR